MEAIEDYSASHQHHHHHDHRDHHSLVVKGKRTKRLRLPSPPQGFTAAITSSSSTAYEHNSVVSPSSSSGNNNHLYESTEEEEDMANCLILLAQGDAPRRIEEEEESDFCCKKFSEAPAIAVSPAVSVSATARSGFDVYECKTCNRAFPSFQALGGHRASHKKPKTVGDEQKKPPVAADLAIYGREDDRFVKRSASPPLPFSLANKNKSLAASASSLTPSPFQVQINTRPKIHGCSICGSEFTSGQALGGHMRRHRAPPPVTASGNSIINGDSSTVHEKPRNNILGLDLNLPAPEEEKFQFAAAQPPIVVFSSPALVDCHY